MTQPCFTCTRDPAFCWLCVCVFLVAAAPSSFSGKASHGEPDVVSFGIVAGARAPHRRCSSSGSGWCLTEGSREEGESRSPRHCTCKHMLCCRHSGKNSREISSVNNMLLWERTAAYSAMLRFRFYRVTFILMRCVEISHRDLEASFVQCLELASRGTPVNYFSPPAWGLIINSWTVLHA